MDPSGALGLDRYWYIFPADFFADTDIDIFISIDIWPITGILANICEYLADTDITYIQSSWYR